MAGGSHTRRKKLGSRSGWASKEDRSGEYSGGLSLYLCWDVGVRLGLSH